MFNKDFIYRKRAAYSQEGCDYTIRFFENRVDLQAEGTFGNLLPDPTLKKCTETVSYTHLTLPTKLLV